jgi:TatD DNase family protein
MGIFETHFHFNKDWDADEYYNEALDAGVEYLLAVGGNEEESIVASEFANRFDKTYFSVGVHPHDSSEFVDDISQFRDFTKDKKCVAVGEIGLDYFYENSDKESQLIVFENFLKLALEVKLPVIIHCRDKDGCYVAYEDSYRLLSDFADKGGEFVIHCYTGSIEWAKKFLDLGAYLGITGIVTFPKAQNVRDILKVIPNDRIVIETDAPYLAPIPFRGKTNHSKYLTHVVSTIATEKGLTDEEVVELTTKNALALFLP